MTNKMILEKAAEFERRAASPTNLMTSNEFRFVAAALRELVALRGEPKSRHVAPRTANAGQVKDDGPGAA